MLSALDTGRDHTDPTMRQYARSLEAICAWRGVGLPELAKEPADLATYLGFAPKFDKRDAVLQRELIWSACTYKQYQRGGRLLIERLTGTLAARRARKAVTNDLWADLRGRATSLARAKLLPERHLASLARIEDLARAEGLQPPELTNERVVALEAGALSDRDWTAIKKVRHCSTTCAPFRRSSTSCPPARRPDRDEVVATLTVPAQLEQELKPWLKRATTTYPEDVESEFPSRGARRALGWLPGRLRGRPLELPRDARRAKDITCVNNLAGCFGEQDALCVLQRWIGRSKEPGGLSARSMAEYFECIQLGLKRIGCSEEERAFGVLLRNHAVLREGRAMSKRVSPGVET